MVTTMYIASMSLAVGVTGSSSSEAAVESSGVVHSAGADLGVRIGSNRLVGTEAIEGLTLLASIATLVSRDDRCMYYGVICSICRCRYI